MTAAATPRRRTVTRRLNSSLQGKSGNPLGRLPGEKQFTDQLRLVLAEPVDRKDPQSVRKMRRIAEKLAECAMNGEGWAICQVADRLDGKPAQDSNVSIEDRRPEELTDEELMAIAAGGLATAPSDSGDVH
jgi:hypothetical protein